MSTVKQIIVDGEHPRLGAKGVHVWQSRLDEQFVPELQPSLSADELERAARFHFAKDRNQFIVARGLLRKLLAGYLDVSPAELRLSYGEMGKPSLDSNGPGSLKFNLAHSNAMAIYAFTRGREIGVDLEYMKEGVATEQIASRFFSPREIATLKALPADLQKQAFFDCWTRKEAYIKARGKGVPSMLDQFNVSLGPGEPAALLDSEADDISRWSMQTLSVAPGYAAALVVEGHDWLLRTFDVML
jgi:4'-phosphopantetheinyl transferase